MNYRFARKLLLCTSMLAFACSSATAIAQDDAAADGVGVQEIVVTAQKRSEAASKVGMSITALAGDDLFKQGITSPNDLVKVVPGFQATEAPRGTPIYAIRGIGFDDSTLGSSSTVALYVDEVPLGFSPEARFATLDLERVEVLKGPQGILFGQNSTAGAINFIAAKPTDTFKAGVDASFGRFNDAWGSAFVSGPLTDTIRVRVSTEGQRSSGWQESYTRDDSLGAKRRWAGRILTEWTPAADLKITLNVNGWMDKSDTQAAQMIESLPTIPSAALPEYDAYPRSPSRPRAADWDANPPDPFRRDDNFFQVSLRGDYSFTDEIVFTSITAWSRYNQDFSQDVDGSDLQNLSLLNRGYIRSFNQEVRLTGSIEKLKWIVGGNYSRDKTFDSTFYRFDDGSANRGFLGVHDAISFSDQPIRTIAAFGNVDYTIGEVVTLHGGLRYTKDKRSFEGCLADPDTDGVQRLAYNIVLGLLGTPNEIQPGGCLTSLNGLPVLVQESLSEDNISWRAGVDFQVTPTTLLYANVGRGYKSGSFPAVNAASALQYRGVTQESVMAYEAGVKAGLFDRKVQLNAAAFYYDYKNKQLRGRILDPAGFFGVLDVLLNIPKSRVYGAEISAQIVPTRGLNLNLSGTYVNSKVEVGPADAYDPVGNILDYSGLAFPHTPKWNVTASADYEAPVSATLNGFIGANLTYQSATQGLFNRPELIGATQPSSTLRPGVFLDPDIFRVKAYTTVDARLGIAGSDDRWRAWIWGRNIFNTYYWNNVTQSLDTIYRLSAMPRTFGVSASLRL